MMPLIHPLQIQETPETEYRKEQRQFAKMQADFHERQARTMRGAMLNRWVVRGFRRLWRRAPRRA